MLNSTEIFPQNVEIHVLYNKHVVYYEYIKPLTIP